MRRWREKKVDDVSIEEVTGGAGIDCAVGARAGMLIGWNTSLARKVGCCSEELRGMREKAV